MPEGEVFKAIRTLVIFHRNGSTARLRVFEDETPHLGGVELLSNPRNPCLRCRDERASEGASHDGDRDCCRSHEAQVAYAEGGYACSSCMGAFRSMTTDRLSSTCVDLRLTCRLPDYVGAT